MTMEEKGEGRSIMVGLPIDSDGRELLDWALGKFAKPGDRIVAVHVCHKPENATSTLSLIKLLSDYLIVYEDFCRLKQVVLVGRVSRGRSTQKILVREAAFYGAVAVVVGVSKSCALSISTSLAKYCAKKLPPTIALIALDKGKIVFERAAAELPQGRKPKPMLRSLLHPNLGGDPKVVIPSHTVLSDILTPQLYGDCLKMHVQNDRSSISSLVRKFPSSPGWPLLRRGTEDLDALEDTEAPKMSVVQWVMTLPNRSLSQIQPQLDNHSSVASLELSKTLERILIDNSSSCRWFRYDELKNSTSQFSSDALIGKGGSCRVYKGCLTCGQEVAIKLLNSSEAASRDFALEVDIITSLKHEHIIPLTGICIEDNNLIFVYNYFQRGSLEENLHGKRMKLTLTWELRFKVAIGIAEALNYLHAGCSRPVIHRDVKSSNILLSSELKPQLSDFNLALWAPTSSSYLTHNNIVGTFGYLAPEYFTYGSVSEKIDVYAFGVVLLELLTGRKPISDENPKGRESLVMWARPILERGDIVDLLDPNLVVKNLKDQVNRMALASSLCIRTAARRRPRMCQILSLLKGQDIMENQMNSYNGTTVVNDKDDEAYPAINVRTHLELALKDVGDDDALVTSFKLNQLNSLEEILRGRRSHSSSFN